MNPQKSRFEQLNGEVLQILKKYNLVILGLAGLIFIGIEAGNRNDFFIFLSASGDLFRGENIFANFSLNKHCFKMVAISFESPLIEIIPSGW